MSTAAGSMLGLTNLYRKQHRKTKGCLSVLKRVTFKVVAYMVALGSRMSLSDKVKRVVKTVLLS